MALLATAMPAQDPSHPMLAATRDMSSADLMAIVEELASDPYEGRLTGSPGYHLAAGYVAGQFSALGLQKPYAEEGYYQYFDSPYTLVLPGCSLVLHAPDGDVNYRYYDEFMPGSSSASGSLTAEVVFAGYGITAPELGYDDYAGIDVKGKIVLIRPEAPVSPSIGEKKFMPWLTYSTHQYKMQNALDHGVAGILYHYGPLANTNNDYHEGLLLTMVGSKAVEDLFAGSGKEYQKLVDGIHATLKPASLMLGKKVTIENSTIHYPEAKGMNVIGILPGSDPALKDEAIIIGGHLDHCGKCWEVCPGANDNASGIAVMLGVARALVKSGLTFKRSIIFMGIGGEESGLLGAKKYVADPIWPTAKTLVMLNLDSVGVGPNLSASGAKSFPAILAVIERANNLFVHRVLNVSEVNLAGRPRTDAAVFNKAGIPAISFSSFGGRGAYHTPADAPDTIWPETLEDLARMLAMAVGDLAGF